MKLSIIFGALLECIFYYFILLLHYILETNTVLYTQLHLFDSNYFTCCLRIIVAHFFISLLIISLKKLIPVVQKILQ